MEDKEREIWAGENRLYLGEDNILYYTGAGQTNGKTAAGIKEAAYKLAGLVGGKVDVIIDHNKAAKPSLDARKIFEEMTENERFGKIAHVGVNPVARVIASFVMGVSGKKEMRFFKTKEEALAWLKKK